MQEPRLDHIGIAVHNLKEAKANYTRVLNFKITHEETLQDRGIEVAFVELANTHLELIGPLHSASEVSSFLEKRGEGMHHICIEVPNLEQHLEKIKAEGGRIVGDGIQIGAHGKRVAFVHPKSAHGVLIELSETISHKCA